MRTDDELLTQTRLHAKDYLRATRILLEDIAEVDRRKLYAKIGFASLYEWLTKDLGLCNATAYRKMQTVRMMQSVPAVAAQIERGEVTLSAVANLQKAIASEEKLSSVGVALERKHELIEKICGKSGREVEQILAREFPEQLKSEAPIRAVGADANLLRIYLTDLQVDKLSKVKELCGHSDFGASWAELIEKLSDEFIKRHDPALKAFKKSEPISWRAKRLRVFRSHGRRCEYVDPTSGRVCESTHLLEIDHVQPKSCGGGDELSNLRVLCRAHNQYRNFARA